ncbi:hypothetical protein BOW53_02995 [Solemya pervernicosa gill symbiont]|uniref:Mu-like prophage I protein n=2 Tax=Solemya pervernicosa gill symbiont TaxID=642797 RepID=A0A1T2L997_9GAMM|nr:hypothetical protein BOW53_02995 [Solemya pervernicosa gill symbiont]
MCHALAPTERVALCFELPTDGSVPEWVELIPAGPEVIGRDKRAWLNDNPQGVLDYLHALQQEAGRDLPFDWEHATELKAPQGEKAPATGWGKAFEIRDGAIWARVEWTENGRNAIAAKEYRYLSPVLVFEKATRRIVGLSSVGLTNRPNLHLTALNREANPGSIDHEETAMKEILKALGLSDDATNEDALNAIEKINGDLQTALNSAGAAPSLDKFIPRGDYEAAVERANNAEQQLADRDQAQLDTDIETAINSALEAGKITPATKEYHTAACREEGGLDRFKAFVESAPVVAPDSALGGKEIPDGSGKATALNAETQEISEIFGNTAEDLEKFGQA